MQAVRVKAKGVWVLRKLDLWIYENSNFFIKSWQAGVPEPTSSSYVALCAT